MIVCGYSSMIDERDVALYGILMLSQVFYQHRTMHGVLISRRIWTPLWFDGSAPEGPVLQHNRSPIIS
ncbi:hypothetical protein TWF128_010340 [Orbilia oligospora]|nr:hypothetical protein TWF128_010340 [Orbilia oligospora]